MKSKTTYSYIDLFCGAGGLSLGFDLQGFENIFSIDIDPVFCSTYEYNFPMHHLIRKDIIEVSEQEVLEIVGTRPVDVVIGGPPCQGFSMAGSIGRRFEDDARNRLFKEFARIVSIVNPKIFLMENVARLYTHNQGKTRQEIVGVFQDLGYRISCKILNAADYGVPQNRYRTIFLGINSNQGIEFPNPTHSPEQYRSVKEALDSLPPLESGDQSAIENHKAMTHSAQMLAKMSYIKDGGDRNDIPLKLRPRSGDVRKYIRYASDKPSVCITGDMRKVFHYSQNRALTVRELARLQSFSDDFVFKGSVISQQQQVGNSVPPLLAEALAKKVKASL